MFDVQQWSYDQAKGRIANHVICGTDRPAALVKSARTMLARYGNEPEALKRMMDEVDAEAVQPFLNAVGSWRKPERLERFIHLKSLLVA